MRIAISHTHAFPGARATVTDDEEPAIVEFSDGSIASGRWTELGPDMATLEVAAYTTARATPVPGHSWTLEKRDGARWKVIGKGPPERESDGPQ